jgi:DNA-directed RNA polymerase specialized sigma24 family protein
MPPITSQLRVVVTNEEAVNEDQEVDVETWVKAAAGGDRTAWGNLWKEIEPVLKRIVAQPRFLGRLGQRDDDRDNIVIAVFDRLQANDFNRLKLYLQARNDNPKLKFLSWLRVVAKRVGIDYLRAHPEYLRRHDADASKPGDWVPQTALPPGSQLGGQRPPMTNIGTAHELVQYARTALPEDQQRAIELWSQSESFDDIARTLGLKNAQAAERMVRAALERLRRKYRPGDTGTVS